ncbi:MAG: FHA domain-containing protein [Propionibacteriaceae bacterium]|jgi:S-DNA-T family DNA segregation ATPase FtsK/SpoIIIE|nr:FHA domain-containing protein [Propionibacteriaceae bacterium]
MKTKLTWRRDGQTATDVTITCDVETTVGDLADYLQAVANNAPTAPVWAASAALPAPVEHRAMTIAILDQGEHRLPETMTLADAGLHSGHVITLAEHSPFDAQAHNEAATLTIVAGPEAGRQVMLSFGANLIGRAGDAAVRLSDLLVSRHHAQLNIADVAEIIDLGSANGLTVNGEPTARQVLHPGDLVEVGDTSFTVQLLAVAPGRRPASGGDAGFIRSPRLVRPYDGRQFPVPEAPKPPAKQRFQVAMLLSPIAMAAAMYFMTKNWMSVIFMAMMPLMFIATYIDNLIAGRATLKRQLKQWRADLDELVSEVGDEVVVERAARLIEHPATSECLDAVMARSSLMWTRRLDAPGFAQLRLGLGALPSRISFDIPDAKQEPRVFHKEMLGRLAPFTRIDGVPVVAELTKQGGLGVAGPGLLAGDVVRALVAQAISLHSPADLRLAIISSPDAAPAWQWAKWLPHTDSSSVLTHTLAASPSDAAALIGELSELIASRADQGGQDINAATPTPVVLLVVEHDAPVEFGRLVELTEAGWRQGVFVIWSAPTMAGLPAACQVFVDLGPEAGAVGYLHDGELVTPVYAETLATPIAERLARMIAPVTDLATASDESSDIPRTVMYTSIVPPAILDETAVVIERWRENSSILTGPFAPERITGRKTNLRAAIGSSAQGIHSLDLRADGPHAFIGGTTGSGKSELLQTWVLAMAVNHSPQNLNFLLVDYKGGSAFADCARLPHTVGLVTDLDGGGVQRALTSLKAELTYREHFLGQHGVKDLIAMQKASPTEAPPSLVIVVDELAALLDEVPQFVDGLINVAQRGRSLGLHLIMATQQPAGVIRGKLRANTNLRVALRVADIDDSNDILGSPIAAEFDNPGRAVSKTGPGRLHTFQAAFVGGHTSQVEQAPDITVETLGFGAPTRLEPPEADTPVLVTNAETDLQRIVDTIGRANLEAELPAPRRPWLDDLAAYYNLGDPRQVKLGVSDERLVFAVADDPEHQAQPLVAFYPDSVGNMAIYGAGGTGKSTLLRTLAIVAGISNQTGPTHVYGLDFSSRGLAMLDGLPHVGAIIDGGDDERVQRLVTWLRASIDERAERYSSVNAASISEYRRIAAHPDEARLLVLVDGAPAFRQAYESGLGYRLWDQFVSIAADGRAVGVHVVMTSDQINGLPGNLAATVQQRVVMRLSSEDDYGFFNLPRDLISPKAPPGRCAVDGLAAQVVLLGDDPKKEDAERKAIDEAKKRSGDVGDVWVPPTDARSQASHIAAIAATMAKMGVRPAPPIKRLAEQIAWSSLTAATGAIALGVRSDDFSTLSLTPTGSLLVAGPPGSGISTTLNTIVRALKARGGFQAIRVLSDRETTVGRGMADAVVVGADAVLSAVEALTAEMAQAEAAGKRLAVIIEGLPDFVGSAAEYPLGALIGSLIKGGHFVVGSGDPTTLVSAYSLVNPFKAGRRALLLQFDSSAPELVQASYPRARSTDFPVGRGLWVERGSASVVQVAM